MKSSNWIYLLVIALIIISCGGEVFAEKEVEKDSFTPEVDIIIEDDDPDSSGLFLFYKEKCEQMEHDVAAKFVDAEKLKQEAFSDKYDRPQAEEAFEWYISKVLHVSESLITMVITSSFEGLNHQYLVTLSDNDEIPQFDQIDNESSFVEVNYSDCVSGKIRITTRKINVRNENKMIRYIDLSNQIYEPIDDIFMKDSSEVGEVFFDHEFEINLLGIDTILYVVSSYCDEGYGEMVLDVYLGESYYGRLPSHYCNLWMPSELEYIEVKDYNSDGIQDFLVVVSAISGIGRDAAAAFPTHSIYFQNNEGGFINFYSIDDKLSEVIDKPEKINDLCSFIDFPLDKEDY